jgi:hypothetical protein
MLLSKDIKLRLYSKARLYRSAGTAADKRTGRPGYIQASIAENPLLAVVLFVVSLCCFKLVVLLFVCILSSFVRVRQLKILLQAGFVFG